MPPFLQVRVPISPTPTFFRRLHYLAASLRDLRGPLADHEIVVSVGEDCEPYDLHDAQPWSKRYPVRWRWIDRDLFKRESYYATRCDRIAQQASARYVMLCDADVIAVRGFDTLVEQLERHPAICGVIAHVSPFIGLDDPGLWDRLFRDLGFPNAPLDFEHSGWGFMCSDERFRRCPLYLNMGMVLGPSALMNPVCRSFMREVERVRYAVGGKFKFQTQVALTLAIYKEGVPATPVPVRYNFPNDPGFDAAYPEELPHIVFLHYLRTQVIDKFADFSSREALHGLLGRTDLSGSNVVLRNRLAELDNALAGDEAAR